LSVGSVLVQPQRVRRAASIDAGFAVLDDLLLVTTRTFADAVAGGDIHASLRDAFVASVERVAAQAEAGFPAAVERLELLSGSLLDELEQQLEAFSSVGDSAGVVEGMRALLDRIADLAESITAETIREPIEELVDIVQVDFGLTPDFLDDEVRTLFDDAVARLEDIPDDVGDDARSNRLAVARALRRLRNRLRGELVFPELDATLLGDELFRWLERTGFLGTVAKFACVARTAADAFTVGGSVVELVPFTGFGGGSVGAAAVAGDKDRFCWYASWLMAEKGRPSWHPFIPLLPADEVWRTEDGHIDLRRRLRDDVRLASNTDDWTKAFIFSRDTHPDELAKVGLGTAPYTFSERYPAETLETVAYVSAVLVNALEMVFHLISLEEGDYASNAFNAFTNAGIATVKLATGNPMDWWLDTLVFRGAGTVMTSLEGTHRDPTPCNWLKMWLTLLGPDLVEVIAYNVGLNLLRSLVLEYMTLRNNVPDTNPFTGEDRHAENIQHMDAIVGVFGSLFGKLLVMLIPREDYCHPFDFRDDGEHFAKTALFYGVFCAFPFGMMGGLLGTLFATKVIAGEARVLDGVPVARLGPGVGPLVSKTLFEGVNQIKPWTFWGAFFSQNEGDTGDGTYNPGGVEFSGYPPADSSPYRLPYPKGKSCYVGQANHGMWSHNFFAGNLVYAYDFSLDEDDVIVASRPGTVVDFFDWVPNDKNRSTKIPDGVAPGPGQTTETKRNFVLIRHDVDDDGNAIAPNDTHDKGPGGTVAVTYAMYMHGRTDSVRAAFAEKLGIDFAAITPANILNTATPVTVKRGEKIMLNGDTGKSFHNHLHLEVRVEKGPNAGRVRGFEDDDSFTVPFLFKEVSRFLDTDGVPTGFNFYTSDNG
jgi:hypothetical protein